jgi:hypothetical protein
MSIGNRNSVTNWPDESESSDEDPIISSQRNSFVLTSDSIRPGKHARIDSELDQFEVAKRPLSSASLSSLASRFAATPINQRTTHDSSKRMSHGSITGLMVAENDSFSSQETIHADFDNDGDAQNALKRLVEGRLRRGTV